MASFCSNCHRDMGFPGEPDIDIKTIGLAQKPGYFVTVLCEGCGVMGIGLNPEGNEIVIVEEDGSIAPWDPTQDRERMCRLRRKAEKLSKNTSDETGTRLI